MHLKKLLLLILIHDYFNFIHAIERTRLWYLHLTL